MMVWHNFISARFLLHVIYYTLGETTPVVVYVNQVAHGGWNSVKPLTKFSCSVPTIMSLAPCCVGTSKIMTIGWFDTKVWLPRWVTTVAC